MRLEWLWNWFSTWPPGVPRLYAPEDSLLPLSPLSDAEYSHLLTIPVVLVLPLASSETAEQDVFLGLGLARRLIRDLALVRDLSIRPPEDERQVYLEAVPQLRPLERDSILVTGATIHGAGFYRVELQVYYPSKPTPFAAIVHETDWGQFLLSLATTVAQLCGAQLSSELPAKWQTAVPAAAELAAFGEVLATTQTATPLRQVQAAKLLDKHPLLPLALPLREEKTCPLATLLRLFEHDPNDISVLLELFLTLSNQQRNHVPSVQFLRRALELSPGNGRAQRLAAVVDYDAASRVRRARIASRLLGLDNQQAVD